ncbi:MAG: GNAT family N-acetyltransferase [Candidatus Peribacteraceae bacterium]|jgi:GNAT superfamily N-acetyltransferase
MNIKYSVITQASDIDVLRGKTSQFKNFNVRYDEETLNYLKTHLADEDSLYLVAKEGDAFAGFCSIDSDWWEDNYFFLREIFVEPAFQQRGIGIELMQRCITHAKKMEATGVVTETAFENLPMQKLCVKCGFIEWENPQWKEGITYKLLF